MPRRSERHDERRRDLARVGTAPPHPARDPLVDLLADLLVLRARADAARTANSPTGRDRGYDGGGIDAR
jgi:hypothetical protein